MRVIFATTLVAGLALVPVGAFGAPPEQVPGCPPGYEKGSTIDFPQFAYADANQNGLVCFRFFGRSGRARAVDDDPSAEGA